MNKLNTYSPVYYLNTKHIIDGAASDSQYGTLYKNPTFGEVSVFENKEWAADVAELLQDSVNRVLLSQGECSVMLTGGRSAKLLYEFWAKLIDPELPAVDFFYGDERCVSSEHEDSNHRQVVNTLFCEGVPRKCNVYRMDTNKSPHRYEELLPDSIDILLLSVGDDGHVASLFPYDNALKETQKKVVTVSSRVHQYQRMTITPLVIKNAKSIFILAIGPEKGRIARALLSDLNRVEKLPVKIAANAHWLMDRSAFIEFMNPDLSP